MTSEGVVVSLLAIIAARARAFALYLATINITDFLYRTPESEPIVGFPLFRAYQQTLPIHQLKLVSVYILGVKCSQPP